MSLPGEAAKKRCRRILDGIPADGLFAAGQAAGAPCRIGPEPFQIPEETASQLESQGRLWLRFLKAAHALYLKSLKGKAPYWIAEYLDAGKPRRLLEFGRMNRFKSQLPAVLRPDLLLTDNGAVACELDSVPGGIGLLACLTSLYEKENILCQGSPRGMANGFWAAMEHVAAKRQPKVGIIVSDESAMYRPEMRWLADDLRSAGSPCRQIDPADLEFADGVPAAGIPADGIPADGIPADGIPADGIPADGPKTSLGTLDVIYRFFELFDLDNVPNSQAMLEAAKLKRVRMTPPPKPHLEEKLLFALLHHAGLGKLWQAELGEEDFRMLQALVMPTWILDSRPLPPHAEIASLKPGGVPLNSWQELGSLSQKDRDFVLKPSGFGPNAWGSRGVHFGTDLSHDDWCRALAGALADFPQSPWILQPYRKPILRQVTYFDPESEETKEMQGRVRLCPYYFVTGEDSVVLGGTLATICPADKKAIHGMPEAVMLPCRPLIE